MKIFMILTLMIVSSLLQAKVSKPTISEDLNFKFEIPSQGVDRSLASRKIELEKKEEKTQDKPRDPASGEKAEVIQKSGIQFWKFD